MSTELRCYRCGASLAMLTPPISRQDECPSCSNYLHVCRMCRHFDKAVPKQCKEDDAEEVTEKERLNFCDWFIPSSTAFDATGAVHEEQAKAQLSALFGDEETDKPSSDQLHEAADDLFK